MKFTWISKACLIAGAACGVVIPLALLYQAQFYPEVGFDEAPGYLGVQILHGRFGLPIDPAGFGGFSRFVVMDCYPPVYYAFSSIVFAIFGFGLQALRATTILFIVGTAIFIFWIAGRFRGYAMGLLALSAYLYMAVDLSQIGRPDTSASFFLLASLWALARANTTSRYAVAGFLYALSVLSHFVALMAGGAFAILLWRKAGLRFWRAAGLWAFTAAWFAAIAAYAIILYPHYSSTLGILVAYGNVGSHGDSSIWDFLPIRSTIQHIQILLDLPIIFGLVGAMFIGSLASLAIPQWRRRLTSEEVVFVAAVPLLIVSIGFYPNIWTITYYAPMYLVPGAVGLAIVIGSATAHWKLSPLPEIAALACVVAVTYYDVGQVRNRVASMSTTPISAALDWVGPGLSPSSVPVIANAQWVFSPVRERTRPMTTLAWKGQELIFSPSLAAFDPGLPPMSRVENVILDQYAEIRAAENAMIHPDWRPGITVGLENTFTETGVFSDVRRSGSYVMFAKHPASKEWPRLGLNTPSGAQDLTVTPACLRDIPVSHPSSGIPNHPGWRRYIYRLPNSRFPLLIRTVVDAPVLPNGFRPPTLVSVLPSETDADALAVAKSLIFPDPRSTLGLALRLPNGQIGRDVIVPPDLGEKPVLALFLPESVQLKRIRVATALPTGETCDSAELDRVELTMKSLPLFLTAPPVTAKVGVPVTLRFNEPQSGEFVEFRNGAVAGRVAFTSTTTPSLTFESPGKVGVEVWTIDPQTHAKAVRPIFLTVSP